MSHKNTVYFQELPDHGELHVYSTLDPDLTDGHIPQLRMGVLIPPCERMPEGMDYDEPLDGEYRFGPFRTMSDEQMSAIIQASMRPPNDSVAMIETAIRVVKASRVGGPVMRTHLLRLPELLMWLLGVGVGLSMILKEGH